MGTQTRKPGGLLDRIIQAQQEGGDGPSEPETLEAVAELLAADLWGDVDEDRQKRAMDLLTRRCESGDVDAYKEMVPGEVTLQPFFGTFSTVGTRPRHIKPYDVPPPSTSGPRGEVTQVARYSLRPSHLATLSDGLKAEGLWPKQAAQWAGVENVQLRRVDVSPDQRTISLSELNARYPHGFRKPDGSEIKVDSARKRNDFKHCRAKDGNGWDPASFEQQRIALGWEVAGTVPPGAHHLWLTAPRQA